MSLNGLQNTYFLAKNLTERLVASYDGRPNRMCILRPSIIGAVARAPCPGFIGNSSGFTAAILGAAAGEPGHLRLTAMCFDLPALDCLHSKALSNATRGSCTGTKPTCIQQVLLP